MTALHVAIILIGGLAEIVGISTWMNRALVDELRQMERRRQEWIANGSTPGEEPNFYTGNGSGRRGRGKGVRS